MSIQIPAPLPGDSDKVVHLLQNAALFGRIGDTDEALHWLRQAAECASDSGDDARTLVLARSAAELSIDLGHVTYANADDGSGVRERRLPTPPPRSGSVEPAADADPAAHEEPVLLLKRVVPDSRATLSPPPLPSVRPNGSRPPASARPRLMSSRPAPPSTRASVPTAQAPRAMVPAAAVAPSLRQAARVSVKRSSVDPALYVVRLLEDDKAPDPGCTEALLVTIDPNARPFAD